MQVCKVGGVAGGRVFEERQPLTLNGAEDESCRGYHRKNAGGIIVG